MKSFLVIALLLLLPASLASSSQRPHEKRRLKEQSASQNGKTEWRQLKARNTHQARNYTFNELYKLQNKFLNAFTYPNNQAQVSLFPLEILLPDLRAMGHH